jgi:hypothetical protein
MLKADAKIGSRVYHRRTDREGELVDIEPSTVWFDGKPNAEPVPLGELVPCTEGAS